MRPLLLFLLFSIHPMHLRRHIEHALRELDTQAGAFVDQLVQELQHEIVRVARLQDLQLADVQIAPRGVRFFVQALDDALDRVALGAHLGLVLKNEKEPVPDGFAGNAETDLFNIVLDLRAAVFAFFAFLKLPHLLDVFTRIRRERAHLAAHAVRRNFQVCRVGRDDILLVRRRFQIKIDGQHLKNFNEPIVLRDDHAANDILDRQPRLDAVTIGRAAVAGRRGRAENGIFHAHAECTSPR